jgi:hypothetical protein
VRNFKIYSSDRKEMDQKRIALLHPSSKGKEKIPPGSCKSESVERGTRSKGPWASSPHRLESGQDAHAPLVAQNGDAPDSGSCGVFNAFAMGHIRLRAPNPASGRLRGVAHGPQKGQPAVFVVPAMSVLTLKLAEFAPRVRLRPAGGGLMVVGVVSNQGPNKKANIFGTWEPAIRECLTASSL